MLDAVTHRNAEYQRSYELVPSFHAALHIGPIVVSEMGDVHREIVFLGDTMNTTARIGAASSELGRDVLASADLVDRLTVPAGIVIEPLGPIPLRGKQHLCRSAL
jgi:adenylate cyclase